MSRRVRFLQNMEETACGVVYDSAYAMAVLADSPLAYWQCQEIAGSGVVPLDTSGNSNNITSINSPDGINYRLPGALTSACDFAMTGVTPTTGVVPNASVPVFSTAVSNFTVSWWFYGPLENFAHGTSSTYLIGNGNSGTNGWHARVKIIPTQSRLNITTFNSGVGTLIGNSGLMSSTDWYHVAIICSSGTYRTLINGAADTTLGTPPTPSTPTGSFRFNFNYSFMSGGSPTVAQPISHVAYWASALSDGQIAAHYAAR